MTPEETTSADAVWTRNRRFDLIYKILLARAWTGNAPADEAAWATYAYLESIRALNGGFREIDPPKHSAAEFVDSFRALVEDVRRRGFAPDAPPVPLGDDGELLNGAHRLAACAACGSPCRVTRGAGHFNWGYAYFQKRKRHFDRAAENYGVREYVRLNPCARLVAVRAGCLRRDALAWLDRRGIVFHVSHPLVIAGIPGMEGGWLWPWRVVTVSFPDGAPDTEEIRVAMRTRTLVQADSHEAANGLADAAWPQRSCRRRLTAADDYLHGTAARR